jgi:hypothetical protein
VARALVALSLILNVVFAFLLVRGQHPLTARAAAAQSSAASNLTATTIESYYRALHTKGLNERERASLMLAYLQERYGPSNAWQPPYATFCDSPANVLDRARDEALSSMGNSAVEDPVFGCLFRPLRREYPELGAAKQVEVHGLLESYYHEVNQAGSYSKKLDSYKSLLAKAAKVLSTSEYDEFMVRASPLAKSIRRMNLELDDARYGTLVQLVAKDERLSQLVLGNVDESRNAAFQSNRIAELLGSESYVRFAYGVDPLGAGAPVGKLGKSLMRDVSANTQKRGFNVSSPTPDSRQ